MTAIDMIDDDTYVGAENYSTLFTVRKNSDAATDEDFPRRFPSGAVVGGPFIQISKSTLVDQNAFASYYADEELQQEAARVVREAARR